MRSIEDKEIYVGSNAISFEFHKHNGGANRTSNSTTTHHHHRTALGKLPTPSKWDDAQKWLVGLSRGVDRSQNYKANKPRNSNADDLRLIASVPQKEQHYSSEEKEDDIDDGEAKTKNVDCGDDPVWRSKTSAAAAMSSICLRDMGTEMTPIVSQEPSRTGTPLRATTPAARSPIFSGSSTPVRMCQQGYNQGSSDNGRTNSNSGTYESFPSGRGNGGRNKRYVEESNVFKNSIPEDSYQARKPNPLETRAMAWDEAEHAKYMARYKREEVKIQAWENHEKRKAEMKLRKKEVKAERMKSWAQEKLTNKLAATKRIAEEKRSNAEAKLNEKGFENVGKGRLHKEDRSFTLFILLQVAFSLLVNLVLAYLQLSSKM